MLYYAHTAPKGEDWEPLHDHLINVAIRACSFASAFGAGDEGYIAGLLHDFGKYGERFQKRLHGEGRHIDHWTPGAWAAIKQYGGKTGRCLALVAQGHHVGLQQDHSSCLRKICMSAPTQGKTLAAESMSDLWLFANEKMSWPPLKTSFYSRSAKWCSDMLDVRMLFSALVDADYLETEKFMHAVESKPQRPASPKLDASRAFNALTKHIDSLKVNKNWHLARICGCFVD